MTLFAFIFYEVKENYPLFISRLFRWLAIVFIIVLGLIIGFPFFTNVNYIWYAIAILSVGLYLYMYKKTVRFGIWYFGIGIIMLRFIYASLYLPIRYEGTSLNYHKEMANVAAKNDYKPIIFYARPDSLDLSINLKMTKFKYESIPVIPFLAFQVPYYYYKSTGHIVRFDTALLSNTNYIAFQSYIKNMHIDSLYSFINQDGERVVLFRKIP